MLDNDEICFVLDHKKFRFAKFKKHVNFFQIDLTNEVYLSNENVDEK